MRVPGITLRWFTSESHSSNTRWSFSAYIITEITTRRNCFICSVPISCNTALPSLKLVVMTAGSAPPPAWAFSIALARASAFFPSVDLSWSAAGPTHSSCTQRSIVGTDAPARRGNLFLNSRDPRIVVNVDRHTTVIGSFSLPTVLERLGAIGEGWV